MIRTGDLMYEQANLSATISYCKARNMLIRDLSEQEVEANFWDIVKGRVGDLTNDNLAKHIGRFDAVFNAWFSIDYTPTVVSPIGNFVSSPSYTINFFVRLGRDPALELVNADRASR